MKEERKKETSAETLRFAISAIWTHTDITYQQHEYIPSSYSGTNETGTALPNYLNNSTLETEAPALLYNANSTTTVDVCKRPGTKIIGGADAGQGDFPYQVNHSEPKRTIKIVIKNC
jgi:hypothetical protein